MPLLADGAVSSKGLFFYWLLLQRGFVELCAVLFLSEARHDGAKGSAESK